MRALLSPQTPSRTLANGPIVWTDGDPTDGHSFDNTNQNMRLKVRNTDAGPQTINIPKRKTADGDTFTNPDLTLAAGEEYEFDLFENDYYGWNDPDNNLTSKNAVIMNVSDATVKLALMGPGSRDTVEG